MALIQCNFHSDVLGMASTMKVILPQPAKTQIGMAGGTAKLKYPVLYLLHGSSDDHSIWGRRTSIERYVAGMDLAVVMPNVHRSYYTDMKAGGNYWTFVSEELPEIVKAFFPISSKREDTFVAGLSMGGYGALKLALRCPEKFAAAASLSGVTDLYTMWREGQGRNEEFVRIFGKPEDFPGSKNDLFALSSNLKKSGKELPLLFQACGTEDFLYEGNIKFRDHLKEINYTSHYQESPGSHSWDFWDANIQDVLKWLPIR